MLVVALTYRVKSWIERTSRVADVIHTPRIGLEAARLIAAWKADAAVGIADLDGLSAGIVDDLREGGPRLALRDASDAVRRRCAPRPIRRRSRSRSKAASIAQRALAQASGRGRVGEIIAAVEAQARKLGAEEIYVAAAPDLARDRRLKRIEGEAALGRTLRAARHRRLQGHVDSPACAPSGRDGRGVRRARRRRAFAAAVAELPGAHGFAGFSSWLVEGCRIAQPLEPLMGSRVAAPQPARGGGAGLGAGELAASTAGRCCSARPP